MDELPRLQLFTLCSQQTEDTLFLVPRFGRRGGLTNETCFIL